METDTQQNPFPTPGVGGTGSQGQQTQSGQQQALPPVGTPDPSQLVNNADQAVATPTENQQTATATTDSSAAQATPTQDSPTIDWNSLDIPQEVVALVSVDSAERYKFFPFEAGEDFIKVAVVDEMDINVQNALKFLASKNKKTIETFPISADEFDMVFKKMVKSPESEIGQFVDAFEEKEKMEEEQMTLSRKKGEELDAGVLKDAPVAKMAEVIIKNAIDGRASDIHIEPMDNAVRVRYRVDGILHNSISLPKKIGPAIVSRIKILSNLKIDEKRKPQDGRFRIRDLGRIIDFRVSTFPISFGEKVVMRILDTKAGVIGLDKLGIEGRDRELLEQTVEEPHGIILVTGPTGSGKSTTLYSVLKILNREGINIVTLEDPVEYVMEGINQSQVKPEIEYNFASGLRSILRQDPDVVMVGEIRDEETAELAIHAALTGHLVLSTLHTNSAIGAVARLVDMGIQPFLLASSLKLLMGQRLVRRICPECNKQVPNTGEDALNMIRTELKKMPKQSLERLKVADPENPGEMTLHKGEGCNHCKGSGMKGRMGIFEMLGINDKVSKLIGDAAHQKDIEKAAKEDGFTTMKQDGIIKVLEGKTTIEEVQRVTEDTNEEEAIGDKA